MIFEWHFFLLHWFFEKYFNHMLLLTLTFTVVLIEISTCRTLVFQALHVFNIVDLTWCVKCRSSCTCKTFLTLNSYCTFTGIDYKKRGSMHLRNHSVKLVLLKFWLIRKWCCTCSQTVHGWGLPASPRLLLKVLHDKYIIFFEWPNSRLSL